MKNLYHPSDATLPSYIPTLSLSDPVSLYLLHHLVLSLFLILGVLRGVERYHIVVLVCISLMANNVENLSFPSGIPMMCMLLIPSLVVSQPQGPAATPWQSGMLLAPWPQKDR